MKRFLAILFSLGVLGFTPLLLKAQARFDRIGLEQGLPYSRVICLLQDRQGYMWVGTRAGLGRWDGYSMTVFLSNPEDSSTLSNTNIWTLYEDHNGAIWIGTEGGGINRYDNRTDRFTRYTNNPGDSSTLSQDRVSYIFEDLENNLWVATSGGGLDRFDSTHGTFTHLYGDRQPYPCGWGIYQRTVLPLDDGRFLLTSVGAGAAILDPQTSCATRDFLGTDIDLIGCPNILDALRDSRGGFWFATSEGLVRLVPETASFIRYPVAPGGNGTSDRNIYDIHEDSKGLIWIGTAAGLDLYDPVNNRFSHYYHDPLDPYSLADNVVYVIREDRGGNVWVGTQRGISVMTSRNLEFQHFRHTLAAGSLVHDDVTALSESRNGSIWIGTFGGGICRFNPRSNVFTPLTEKGLSEKRIYSLLEDRSGTLWAGTYGGGLNRYEPETRKWTVYRARFDDPEGLTHNDIHTLLQDGALRIWIGSNYGVNRIDPATGRFTRYLSDSLSLLQLQVRALYHDGATLWVGSVGGLYRILPDGKIHRNFKDAVVTPGAPFRQHITSIIKSDDGQLWLGTLGAGVYQLDPSTGEWKRYTTRQGLSSDAVCGLFLDRRRQLWITTHGGLSTLDLRNGSVRRFDVRDGLINIQFNPGAKLLSSDGTMYFGGTNGFTVRSAGFSAVRRKPPPVVLTELRIWNNPVLVGVRGSPLRRPLSMTRRIELGSSENMITISFAALDFTSPERNRYRYNLEGHQDQWIDAGNAHTATFTNMSPGEYVFHVTAANPAGVWNEEGASLIISIAPPLWRTKWAYALYVLAVLGLFWLLLRIRVNRVRLQEQLERERVQADQLQELDQLKSRFFSNISHEFRTPLTLILGPAAQISERSDDAWLQKKAGVISVHARRLLQLVNQILDLSRIDAGKMEIALREEDIIPMLRGITASFASHAEERGIALRFSTGVVRCPLHFDREALEHIVVNLLSNAFRFTDRGGSVTVNASLKESPGQPSQFRIEVQDSGCGIPAERLPLVFDRFYRAHDQTLGGTGIGLALVRELVTLHHGDIAVRSREGEGSTFTVTLPSLNAADAVASTDAREEILASNEIMEEMPIDGDGDSATDAGKGKHEERMPLILLVDDHADMREYMQDILVPNYRVVEAADGEQGVALASAAAPDLIISDVMMPVMDGFGLCRAIRADTETSHIPVILLTARGDDRSRMMGLEEGANDYLTKPFDPEELQLRVRNLIAIRRAQAARFASSEGFRLDPRQFVSKDQEFLDRIIALVDGHLSDEDLNPAVLFDEVGMSRSNFQRKLKVLTDMSPARFIRSIRLRRAKEMLEQGAGSIAEITYSVGFGSQSYFTTCFREEFGMTPGEAAAGRNN